ncbi:MAG: hypothetical protein LBR89_00855 [Holosporales bacterium]|jgi:phosphoribosylpyrophosphate synthetase|nr:hypothetical protein [Holosporales bacterium]
MYILIGEESDLLASFVACLTNIGAAFHRVPVNYHPDGEVKFDELPPFADEDVTLIQLPLRADAYVHALGMSRELRRRRHEGAMRTLCFPYMPYARSFQLQDVLLSADSAQASVGEPDVLLSADSAQANVGAPRIKFVAVDVHNSFDERVCNLYPVQLFVSQIRQVVRGDCFVLAPDKGACWRAKQIADALGVSLVTACKKRQNDFCESTLSTCPLGETCIIVDDIVASGSTVRAAIKAARNIGATRIVLVITHTLQEDAGPILSEVDAWITTNTFVRKFAHTVDIAPFIIERLN